MKIRISELRGMIQDVLGEALSDPPPGTRTDMPKRRGTFRGETIRTNHFEREKTGMRPITDPDTGETSFIPAMTKVAYSWVWDGTQWNWTRMGNESQERLAAAKQRAVTAVKPKPMSAAERQAEIDAFLAKKRGGLKESKDDSLMRGIKSLKDRAVMSAGDDDLDEAERKAYEDLAAALDDVASAFKKDLSKS